MRSDVRLSDARLPGHAGVRPVWPGSQVGELFVRRGPEGREPGVFVHGLGGSATSWTDLMRLLEGVVDSGDQDRLVDVAIAPRAARTYPDVRLLVLRGVGHVAQMERPDVVARAFLGMLEELAERGAVRQPGG